MIGSAIDTYFHVRVRCSAYDDGLSKSAQSKILLPLGEVDDLLAYVVANREVETRPRVRMKRLIGDAVSKRTFQGSKDVTNAFGLLGIPEPWTAVGKALGVKPDAVQRRLDSQYQLRNLIAHEGHYVREERPRALKYRAITPAEVSSNRAWVGDFLVACDTL
jgi:hypothetical protein